jgi:NADH-quinone oxidoreductase subunit F
VIDDSVNIDWVLHKTLHFFSHESCGKCTPCREGTFWMRHIIDRVYQGQATWSDVELLNEVALQIKGKCLCALGEFAIEAVTSGIERFEPDFRAKVQESLNEDELVVEGNQA